MSFAVVVGKVNEQAASGRRGVLALPDVGKASSDTESPAASDQRLGATIARSVASRPHPSSWW
jgi:hypothetical protein